MPRYHPHFVALPHLRFLLVATVLILALFLLLVPSAGADVEVTACGDFVAADQAGYLTRDLDCADYVGAAVVLSDHARLYLGGHVLSGDSLASGGPTQGVRCRSGTVCSVIGPGTIVGFSGSGIAGTRVRVRDVVIAGNRRAGVAAYENVRLRNVFIDANGALGVHAGGRVRRSGDTVVTEHPQAAVLAARAPVLRPVCSEN